MIGPELDDAIARVAEALEVQGRKRKLTMDQLRHAIELWETLRTEAIADEANLDDCVQVEQLGEASQVAMYDRSVRLGSSLTQFAIGFFSDKVGRPLEQSDLDAFAETYPVHAQAKIGTEMGLAGMKAIRIGTTDVNRGVAHLDPKAWNVSLYGTSVIAEDEFTEAEERGRRARWILRYVIATQTDRDMHPTVLELDDHEMGFVRQMVERIESGENPDHEELGLLGYLLEKTQPHNRLFGTTAGIEELWLRQVQDVLGFLREFPTMNHDGLNDIEIRMVEHMRETAADVLDDSTLGGALHRIEDGKCAVCGISAEEAVDRVICSDEARDKVDSLMPLGSLPDMYLLRAKMMRIAQEAA